MKLGEFLASRGILLATRNRHKSLELGRLLESRGIQVLPLPDSAPKVPETEDTFSGNAALKARAAAEFLMTAPELPDGLSRQTVVLADDSGIVVDALGGGPGVQSARYGGPGLDDEGRLQLLLREIADVPEHQRTARYVCVLALYVGHVSERPFADDLLLYEGRCEGRIAFEKRGEGGFGYDPIFFDPELGKTFAEISPQTKDARSHRGRALQKFLSALDD